MAKYIFVTGGVTSSLGERYYCRFVGKAAAGTRFKRNHTEI
jgi:CTP synthase (UTP-ammonia lyase)